MISRIPDEALVVRGGRNTPDDLNRGIGKHPNGVFGVSVECREGLTAVELAAAIPHRQVGVTSVKAIRSLGGDVVRTSGRSANHATLVGLDPSELSLLLTPTPNPARKP